MDSQKLQVAERIKQSNNILVTVSTNPSVDQLAACIGLTLSLNKMGKHATAVFSGAIPSTLEFLQPEKTIEKNTDSLRDFIISLDKSKADKLRYKVEDKVVKIFITPYRTSINDKDLEFSQGDFNVDVVLALGVHNQVDLDQAITAHGRILHDATVATLNVRPGGELGNMNWLDAGASSLSELATELINALDKKLLDGQIATALLTGIVAETERFSNAKTSPQTMSISAELMSVGANQQLVATKLEAPTEPTETPGAPIATQQGSGTLPAEVPKKPDDGTLEIAHEKEKEPDASAPSPTVPIESETQPADNATRQPDQSMPAFEAPKLPEVPDEPSEPSATITVPDYSMPSPAGVADQADEEVLPPLPPHTPPTIIRHSGPPRMMLEPPTSGDSMSSTGIDSGFGLSGEDDERPAGLPKEDTPLLGNTDTSRDTKAAEAAAGMPGNDEEPQNAPGTTFLGDQLITPSEGSRPDTAGKTLREIEENVHSSHLDQEGPSTVTPEVKAADNDDAQIKDEQQSKVPIITPDTPLSSEEISKAFVPSEGQDDKAPETKEEEHPTLESARDAVAKAMGEPQDGTNNAPLAATENTAAQQDDGVPPLGSTLPPAPAPWTPPQENVMPQVEEQPTPITQVQIGPNGEYMPNPVAPPSGPPPMMPPPTS